MRLASLGRSPLLNVVAVLEQIIVDALLLVVVQKEPNALVHGEDLVHHAVVFGRGGRDHPFVPDLERVFGPHVDGKVHDDVELLADLLQLVNLVRVPYHCCNLNGGERILNHVGGQEFVALLLNLDEIESGIDH